MARSDDGLFRGSELSRLIFLIGILIAGGLFVYQVLARQTERDAVPPPRTVTQVPLPPPDDDIALTGVTDRAPLNPRENPGYLMLLDRMRNSPTAELTKQARRDVLFSQLIDNPSRYRGLPIHVEGTLLRCLEQSPIDSKLFPDGRFYEAWVITADSQDYPWILVFENPPANLPIGDDLRAYISFDGYFFKLMAYVAGDTPRFAPLLVGQISGLDLESDKGPAAAATPSSIPWWLAPLAVLFLFAILRWVFYLRSLTRRRSRTSLISTVNDEIDPERLAAWLNSPNDSSVIDDSDEQEPPNASE